MEFLLLLSTSTGLKMGISVILGGSSTGDEGPGEGRAGIRGCKFGANFWGLMVWEWDTWCLVGGAGFTWYI